MEREDALPTEGYMLDFLAPDFDAAERMGMLPALYEIHYPIGHFRISWTRREGSARISRMRSFVERYFATAT